MISLSEVELYISFQFRSKQQNRGENKEGSHLLPRLDFKNKAHCQLHCLKQRAQLQLNLIRIVKFNQGYGFCKQNLESTSM